MGYKSYLLVFLFLVLTITPFVFGSITSFVSLYGAYIFFYSMMQIVMAQINRYQVTKRYNTLPTTNFKYNILVVGYREDPEIFEECLKSAFQLGLSPKVDRVLVVIDGKESQDHVMTLIFCKIFPTGVCLSDDMIDVIPDNKYICINQQHAGKRHVLYTGLKLSIAMKTFGVLCTDSDTVLDSGCLDALSCELESSADIGAVTGDVKITNSLDSSVSFMSSIRYWFACNVERAYQSFNGNVLCVSGPLGVYRLSYVSQFLDAWLNQEFLGQPCTYGDDRHLTNNILMMGKKVKYTHLAKCKTDTPTKLAVFFRQQTRWNKSSFREVIWTLRCINDHSILLGVDLIYQLVYSTIVIGSLIYIFVAGDIFTLGLYLASVMLFNFVKGLYALAVTNNLKYLMYAFYGFIYITILIPARLYAGLTMRDTSWMSGTSSHHYILGIWWILLIVGLISVCL